MKLVIAIFAFLGPLSCAAGPAYAASKLDSNKSSPPPPPTAASELAGVEVDESELRADAELKGVEFEDASWSTTTTGEPSENEKATEEPTESPEEEVQAAEVPVVETEQAAKETVVVPDGVGVVDVPSSAGVATTDPIADDGKGPKKAKGKKGKKGKAVEEGNVALAAGNVALAANAASAGKMPKSKKGRKAPKKGGLVSKQSQMSADDDVEKALLTLFAFFSFLAGVAIKYSSSSTKSNSAPIQVSSGHRYAFGVTDESEVLIESPEELAPPSGINALLYAHRSPDARLIAASEPPSRLSEPIGSEGRLVTPTVSVVALM